MKQALPLIVLLLLSFRESLPLSAQTVGPLYSMTYGGGVISDPLGVITGFDPLNNSDTALLDFNLKNGKQAYGNLIQAKDGMLYGMTPYGGSNANGIMGGVIFKYNLITKQDTVLYNFNSNSLDASTSYGTLLVASNGLFYGISYLGDTTNIGTIFSFDPKTSTETPLINMRSRTIGSYSTSSFIQATDGLLYAMATNSTTGFGTIFSYNIINDSAYLLYTFTGAPNDGNYPRGSLIQASNGLLYGLTQNGGISNDGILFSYNTVTHIETVLVNFTGTNGAHPQESLMQASDSNLYGTTSGGGTYNNGTLFRYNIAANTETVIYSFDGSVANGGSPFDDVIEASNGLLYGNTNLGGAHNEGVIFSYNPSTNTEKTLYSYNDTTGALPYGDFLEVMSVSVSVVNNNCPNDSSGSTKINVRGGKYPFTYIWSNGNTSDSASNLKSGVYTITVTDSRGITLTISDTVKPLPMVISFQSGNPCSGSLRDSTAASVSGGTAPFTYSWSNGSTNDTLYNVSPGTYTLTIRDANGCPAISRVIVNQGSPIMIDSVTIVKASCPGCTNGSITVYASGGIPQGDSSYYYYLWSNGGPYDSSTLSNLAADTFAVCVTSPYYGCGSVCDSNLIVLTGINGVITKNGGLKVYPNPGNGKFIIQIVNGELSMVNYEIQVYNVLGERVYSSFTTHHSPFTIDLSNQPDGVYLLHLTSAKWTIAEKLLIQK